MNANCRETCNAFRTESRTGVLSGGICRATRGPYLPDTGVRGFPRFK
jgi:hypothetical protein